MRICHFFLAAGCILVALSAEAQVRSNVTIGTGWHPGYEIKADPEDAGNLIICGSKWDASRNSLYGFVYRSSDGGNTWRSTFEDRATTWVSEVSCAFGPKHKAYFMSGASKVVDGINHHHQGITRLFSSADGGEHWAEASKTGWADYSTSAVSTATGNLVTFFNDGGTYDKDRNWGSSVGVLIFSPDGKKVTGPFFDPKMKELNYQGALPSNAITLRDGTAVALFFSARNTPDGREYELGLERVRLSPSPSPASSVIARTKRCLNLDGYSATYNWQSNKLLVAYSDDSGGGCHLMLASSQDSGRTWTKKEIRNGPQESDHGINHVSLAQQTDGTLGLLWEDSGRWLFSTMKDETTAEPPIELARNQEGLGVSDDSLMTVIYQPNGPQPESADPHVTVGVNVRSLPGVVLESGGLLGSGNQFQAVFPIVDREGESLRSAILSSAEKGTRDTDPANGQDPSEQDVTKHIVLLNGRSQSFDNATGMLSVEVRLGNRGDKAIWTPIHLEVESVSSKVGKVTIVNADNGLAGRGAVWDLSSSITGDQIPPGATTYNTITLLFHIELEHSGPVSTYGLLDLRARVFGRTGAKVAEGEKH
jgi:hypothetical protein